MMEKIIKTMSQVGVLHRPSFLSEGLRLPKKLDLHKPPLANNIAMLVAMSFCHPCLKSSTGEVLAVV